MSTHRIFSTRKPYSFFRETNRSLHNYEATPADAKSTMPAMQRHDSPIFAQPDPAKHMVPESTRLSDGRSINQHIESIYRQHYPFNTTPAQPAGFNPFGYVVPSSLSITTYDDNYLRIGDAMPNRIEHNDVRPSITRTDCGTQTHEVEIASLKIDEGSILDAGAEETETTTDIGMLQNPAESAAPVTERLATQPDDRPAEGCTNGTRVNQADNTGEASSTSSNTAGSGMKKGKKGKKD